MPALYRLLRFGVKRSDTGEEIDPRRGGAAWDAYRAWVRAGGVPDPYVAPTLPAETLAQAKARKIAQIKAEGVARAQTRFVALENFDVIQLIRETVLSIAPAARAPTADFTWLEATYQAGRDAVLAVNAATTIAQVDAVTPAWPAL